MGSRRIFRAGKPGGTASHLLPVVGLGPKNAWAHILEGLVQWSLGISEEEELSPKAG